MNFSLSLETYRAAQERIRPYVRQTPIAPAPPLTDELHPGLRIKLENLQVTGSFKPRGVFNTLLQLSDEQRARGVITASGGNHGVAVAYAAWRLGLPAIVYLPASATEDRVARVSRWGARVIQHGAAWDDAHEAASQHAVREGIYYIHPFDAELTLAGQGTLGLELLDDAPDVDCVLIAIGGGGLIAGMANAIKQAKPAVRIIGVEPVGAASMQAAVDAGRVVVLPELRTIADTLAPRAVSERTRVLTAAYVDEIVLVNDDAMIDSMRWLWTHYNQLVEPSGAAVIAALRAGAVNIDAHQHPVALICGGNADAASIWTTYQERAEAKARG
ncbi:MAG: threonine/serine dehydratase [Anaerolineae bacterium]|nr:threonine/serine dehydratase [Anaerolineae bacterium]